MAMDFNHFCLESDVDFIGQALVTQRAENLIQQLSHFPVHEVY